MGARWVSKYLFGMGVSFTIIDVGLIRWALKKNALLDEPLSNNEVVEKLHSEQSDDIIIAAIFWPIGLPCYFIERHYIK